jgi:hypothetical protein
MTLQGEPMGNVASIQVVSEPRPGERIRKANPTALRAAVRMHRGHGAWGGVPSK